MKFGADIHGSQRMNPTDCGDPLTFHLAPPARQCFHLSSYKGCIGKQNFYPDNYDTQMMHRTDFGDALTFFEVGIHDCE